MFTIVIMVGIFVLMYFLMIRPQRKRMQAQQNLLRSLEEGDDILTSAGIYGRISSFDDDSLYIEVSDDNYLKITRDSIAQKIVYHDPTSTNGQQPQISESSDEASGVEEKKKQNPKGKNKNSKKEADVEAEEASDND